MRVATLVDSGIWTRLDRLLLPAAHNQQAALLAWKGETDAAIGGGAHHHITDRGYWVDGHDDWIDTGFTPVAGVQFQQGSAMVGVWSRKAERNAAAPVGTVTGTAVSRNPRGSTDANAGRLNGTAVTSRGPVASGYGFTATD